MKKILSVVLCIVLLVSTSTLSISAESNCHDCSIADKIIEEASIDGQELLCPQCNTYSVSYHEEILYGQLFTHDCIHGRTGKDLCRADMSWVFMVCGNCSYKAPFSPPSLISNTVEIIDCLAD